MSAAVGSAGAGGAAGAGAGRLMIAANFKCFHTRASFAQWAAAVAASPAAAAAGIDVIAAPAATSFLPDLPACIQQAAQNFYPAQTGAFTGEIGAAHLDEFGIRTVIIGHCERRALGECDEFLARKAAFAKERGWRIIYCIGEDAATYERGERLAFCAQQLRQIDLSYAGLVIAYEPIYSIGKTAASSADIAAMMRHLRALAPGVPLLYGGSVKPANIAEILSLRDGAGERLVDGAGAGERLVDGALIGSASLDAADFCELLRQASTTL